MSEDRVQRGDNHTYPPVGHCIYCGTTEGNLSKEHIIPYALNGNWVLPKASCESCRQKTQKFEEVCTQERYGMFAPLRHRLRMQSRSKSTRRREFLSELSTPDGSELVPFEADGFPAAAYGMRFAPAGILLGIDPSNKIEANILFRTRSPSKDFVERAKSHGPSGKVKIGSFWPTAFLQLLAKIGYSFAAAELGTQELLPMLSDVILGRTDKSPYLVGGGGLTTEPRSSSRQPDADESQMTVEINGQVVHPSPIDIGKTRKPYGHSLNIHTRPCNKSCVS